MTQKEKLEILTGEKFPEPTPQELTKIQLENTPFWLIGSKQQGYNIIMGKYKLNKDPLKLEEHLQPNDPTPLNDYKKELLAKEWLEENKWNIQLSIAICVTTDLLNNKNVN